MMKRIPTKIIAFAMLCTAGSPAFSASEKFAPLNTVVSGQFLPIADSLNRPVASHTKKSVLSKDEKTLTALEDALAPRIAEPAKKTMRRAEVNRAAPAAIRAKASPVGADTLILSLFAEAGEGPFSASFR